MNFFISDNHFNHANIIKYQNRPFKDALEMDRYMIKKWNSVVGINDTVYHMGDFGFKKNAGTFTKVLNGKIILIMGNHDKESQCHGHFHEIHKGLQIEIDGKTVNLKHYPYKPDVGKFDIKFLNRMLDDDGLWLLHGHVHNSAPKFVRKSINCSVELWDYTPISEEEIIKHMQEYPNGL